LHALWKAVPNTNRDDKIGFHLPCQLRLAGRGCLACWVEKDSEALFGLSRKDSLDLIVMAGMRQGGERQQISQAMSPLISSNAFTSHEENEKIEKGALRIRKWS